MQAANATKYQQAIDQAQTCVDERAERASRPRRSTLNQANRALTSLQNTADPHRVEQRDARPRC